MAKRIPPRAPPFRSRHVHELGVLSRELVLLGPVDEEEEEEVKKSASKRPSLAKVIMALFGGDKNSRPSGKGRASLH